MFFFKSRKPFKKTNYRRVCKKTNTTCAKYGAGTAHLFGTHDFNPDFCGVRVARFVDCFLCNVCRPLFFGHCFVCASSTYGFWLPLRYLQTFPANLCTILQCFFINNSMYFPVHSIHT
jgi:hypothetical protein